MKIIDIIQSNPDAVLSLIKARADITGTITQYGESYNLASYALLKDRTEWIKALLDRDDFDVNTGLPNIFSSSILEWSIRNNDNELMELCLSKGSSIHHLTGLTYSEQEMIAIAMMPELIRKDYIVSVIKKHLIGTPIPCSSLSSSQEGIELGNLIESFVLGDNDITD